MGPNGGSVAMDSEEPLDKVMALKVLYTFLENFRDEPLFLLQNSRHFFIL
jgi:hypothetical protein